MMVMACMTKLCNILLNYAKVYEKYVYKKIIMCINTVLSVHSETSLMALKTDDIRVEG